MTAFAKDGDNSPARIAWVYDGDHLRHPILRQAACALVEAGHDVTVIDRAPATATTGGYRHQRYAREAPTGYVATPLKLAERMRCWWFYQFLWAKLLQVRPQVIVATLPTAAWQAWKLKRLLGARLVYYPFELFGEQSVAASKRWIQRERLLLKRAVDAVITQNAMRAQVYKKRGSRVEPVVVHNYKPGWPIAATGKLRRHLQLPEATRIVLYEGLIIAGRNLIELVRAAHHFPDDVKLVLMGKHSGWCRDELLPLIERELAGKVLTVAPVPADEVVEWVADADAGIMIYDRQWLNNYYCEPGKLSDYVLAGVPILAPNYPSIAPRIRDAGIGVLFDDVTPAALANAALAVLERPKSSWLPALNKAARAMVWRTQAPLFLSTVLGERVAAAA